MEHTPRVLEGLLLASACTPPGGGPQWTALLLHARTPRGRELQLQLVEKAGHLLVTAPSKEGRGAAPSG